MVQVVNLRIARKRRDSARQRAEAAENAVRFGRTKAQKETEQAQSERAKIVLDAHRREDRDG